MARDTGAQDAALSKLGKALVAFGAAQAFECTGMCGVVSADEDGCCVGCGADARVVHAMYVADEPRSIPVWQIKDLLGPSPHASIIDIQDLIREVEAAHGK